VHKLAILLLAVLGVGQPAPDLSGTWMVIGDRSTMTDGKGRTVNMRVLGEMFVVKQAGDELRLALENGNGPASSYRLDGVETVNEAPTPSGRVFRVASRAVWDGSRLTITTSPADQPTSARTMLILSQPSAETLRVEAQGPQGQSIVSVYGRIR
jgi:hypothetical protein